MSRTRTNRSIAGMALLSVEGDLIPGDGLDIDEQHGDGADAALLDMQETNAELGSNDGAVADLENTAMALESLLESAESSVDTGGLDSLSAEILTKAVNNETAPLGTDAGEVVPALESFKSSTDRRQATLMAVEGIKDWIEKVWAKIKEYINKGRELAKKLYIKVKQAIAGLERRVKGLKTELEGRDEKAKKAGQVELADGRWVVDKAAVVSLKDTVGKVLGEYTAAAISSAETIATALSANDAAKASKEGGTDEAGEKAAEAKAAKKEFIVPEKLSNATLAIAKAGVKLPGGRKLIPETVGFSVQEASAAGGSVAKYTGAPLSHAALNEILDELALVAKDVTEYERDFNKRDEAARKVTEAGDKFAKAAKSDAAKGTEGEVRAAINAAKDAATLLDRPIRGVLSYSATAINGICGFVGAHIKHYDKK